MKEILIKLKEAYVVHINGEINNPYGCAGLCYVAEISLTPEEDIIFQNFLSEFKKNRKVFYSFLGTKTSYKGQFVWTPTNTKVRLDWLDKQIANINK